MTTKSKKQTAQDLPERGIGLGKMFIPYVNYALAALVLAGITIAVVFAVELQLSFVNFHRWSVWFTVIFSILAAAYLALFLIDVTDCNEESGTNKKAYRTPGETNTIWWALLINVLFIALFIGWTFNRRFTTGEIEFQSEVNAIVEALSHISPSLVPEGLEFTVEFYQDLLQRECVLSIVGGVYISFASLLGFFATAGYIENHEMSKGPKDE